jgi:hypothetical protein
MSTATLLLRYAKARDNAYRMAKVKSLAKIKAIHEIKTIASNYLKHPEHVQVEAVARLKKSILLILPSSESRFQKQRNQILKIINLHCHE